MEIPRRRKLNIPVILRFGPYWAWGTMKHRTQRLYGLITKLEELGYSIFLDPDDTWDQLLIIINEVIIFKCRQTFLKYSCEYDEDPVCKRAVEAVKEMYPKIMAAAQAVGDFEEIVHEVHPAGTVLDDLICSLPLRDTPVEAVLRTLLDSLPLIDTIPEAVIYSLINTLWLSESVPEALIHELVRKIPTYAPDTALAAVMDSVMQSAAGYPPHAILHKMLQRLPLPTKCKCRAKKQPPHTVIHEVVTKLPEPLVCNCEEVSETEISKTEITEGAESVTEASEAKVGETLVSEIRVIDTKVSDIEVSEVSDALKYES